MKNNKYGLIILFLLSATIGSNAQVQTDTIPLPEHIIKFSPINLLDFNTPAIQFSYEKKLKNNAALQLELGYINELFYSDWLVQPVQGYRAKFELRRYDFWHTKSTKKNYIGGMILLKQSFKEKNGLFNRYDGLYQQHIKYQDISTGFGAYFTMGKQFILNNNMSIEIGFAAGFRYLYLERTLNKVPSDAELQTSRLFDVKPGSYIFPSAFPVFKFGYYLP